MHRSKKLGQASPQACSDQHGADKKDEAHRPGIARLASALLGTNAPVSPAGAWRHQSRVRQPIDNRCDVRIGVHRMFTVRERTVLGTGPQLDDVVKAEDAAADRASDAQQPARAFAPLPPQNFSCQYIIRASSAIQIGCAD